MKKLFLLLTVFFAVNSFTKANVSFDDLQFSDETNQYWYYIESIRSSDLAKAFHTLTVETYEDTDLIKYKPVVRDNEEFLWKLVGDANSFHLINKAGKVVSVAQSFTATNGDKNCVTASGDIAAAEELTIEVWKDNSDYVQIKYAAGDYFDHNSTYWNPLLDFVGNWTKDGEGAQLKFYSEDYFDQQPYIPEDGEWHYIVFQKGDVVLERVEDGSLKTAFPREDADGQLWKVVKTGDEYLLESKAGGKIAYATDTYTTTAAGTELSLLKADNISFPLTVIIKRDATDNALSQTPNAGLGKIIGEAVASDASVFKFIKADEIDFTAYPDHSPVISNANSIYWYYIVFQRNNADLYLTDMGENQAIKVQNLYEEGEQDTQIWKLTGVGNEYIFTNKEGNSIQFKENAFLDYDSKEQNGFVTVSDITEATTLSLRKEVKSDYKGAWTIAQDEDTNSGFNPFGGSIANNYIGLYGLTDGGSAVRFVLFEAEDTALEYISVAKAQVSVSNKALKVEAENIKDVTIFSATGQMIDSKAGYFEFMLPSSGYYLVAINYTDGTREVVKVVLK
ncbi:hypothetical protein D0T49_07265 [Paludibacter sp. 221]|uniref:hypothetical protein n=1 Tax=Paludibacter sp. 221 TaxID=2302939 RepID=UPI0013D74B18|nr:hypothetical protein [Paludibacter sp. 221]NDV46845.1 hypothetical protein [Paludibacter sp. 221]